MAEPVNDILAEYADAEWVTVMGMRVPLVLKERMVRAARGRYPELAQGKDDDAVVRDLTKFWWVTLLAEFEMAEAEAPVIEVIEATKEEYRQRGKAAKFKVLQDAALITEEPPAGPGVSA